MPQGTTTVDFGAGEADKTVTVAAAGITGGQLVEAWIFPAVTASNTVDDHFTSNIQAFAHSVNAGVGFSITVVCREGLAHGIFNIGWVYA